MQNINGYIHSRESAGTLDGPGIRTILFLQGCPLNCLYCHNADTRAMKGGLATDSYTELARIAKQKDMLIRMKGGVTLSGGEPLCQPDFVKSIFEGCKQMGLHTALDTSGFLGRKADDELLSFTDLVLLDIKSFHESDYQVLTGRSLQPTLAFAERLASISKPIWLRYVLVPGFTDNMKAIGELALYAHKLGNVQRVEILPFHKMGEFKWKELGMDYKLTNTPEPTKASVDATKAIFEDLGLAVY